MATKGKTVEECAKLRAAAQPTGRNGTPEEVVDAALFLAKLSDGRAHEGGWRIAFVELVQSAENYQGICRWDGLGRGFIHCICALEITNICIRMTLHVFLLLERSFESFNP